MAENNLYKLLNRETASGLIATSAIRNKQDFEEEIPKTPVTETIDLQYFKKIGRKLTKRASYYGKKVCVRKSCIYFTSDLGEEFSQDAKIQFYLNAPGTILVVKEEDEKDSVSLRIAYPTSKSSKAKKCRCTKLLDEFKRLNISLPVYFDMQWDEKNKAWVGKRENLETKTDYQKFHPWRGRGKRESQNPKIEGQEAKF